LDAGILIVGSISIQKGHFTATGYMYSARIGSGFAFSFGHSHLESISIVKGNSSSTGSNGAGIGSPYVTTNCNFLGWGPDTSP
jgi:hypothetical protein